MHSIRRPTGPRHRTEESRRKELQRIEAYKDLVDLVNRKIAERQYTLEVLALTTKLLNDNPEYYTIWNHRRRVLQSLFSEDGAPESTPETKDHNTQDLITGDIQLTFKLLRQYPKCYWLWNHRNWLLRQGENLLPSTIALKLWRGELEIVSKMLHADSRNFHAWDYRRIVVAQIERISSSLANTGDNEKIATISMTESEFEYTTKMINTNLSNFSAWHYRSKLIPRLLTERVADDVARKKMLDSELSLICKAINTDPFDQSIWFYHQFLLSTISPNCPRRDAIAPAITNHDRLKYYEHEMEYIREILEDEEDCKWIYEALLYLASSYLEIEGGTKVFTTMDMRSWLEALRRLDPLHKGRWNDLEKSLGI